MERIAKILILSLVTLLLQSVAYAQGTDNIIVWPGDINNNGEVNHLDLLYLGVAYNHTGDTRNQQISNWGGFSVPDSLWEYDYFNGINYCYADCNGDGIVNVFDQFVIEDNYGLTHGSIDSPEPPVSMIGVDPQLSFNLETVLVQEGQEVTVLIRLGDDVNPVTAFHGVGFTLAYNSGYIEDGSIVFTPIGNFVDSFDPQAPILDIQVEDPQQDKFEIAITRTDAIPISGNSLVGVLNFVIIGDVPDVIDDEILIIKEVFMVDEYLQVAPVNGDTLGVEILTNNEPPILASLEEVEVYPNPIVGGQFNLQLPEGITVESIQLFDMAAKEAILSKNNEQEITIVSDQLPVGIYILKITTNKGILHKKIFISEQ